MTRLTFFINCVGSSMNHKITKWQIDIHLAQLPIPKHLRLYYDYVMTLYDFLRLCIILFEFFMTMYGYVWLYYVWLSINMYVYIWLNYDDAWLSTTLYAYVWNIINLYDIVWLCMILCTNAHARVINARTRDKTCARAFTTFVCASMHESSC